MKKKLLAALKSMKKEVGSGAGSISQKDGIRGSGSGSGFAPSTCDAVDAGGPSFGFEPWNKEGIEHPVGPAG
jgi:hypothetical protein